MSSSKSSTKNTQAQTSSKDSGKQAKRTVQVGGGVLDRTTFKMYDIKQEMTVYAAAMEVSSEVIDTVYKQYGSEPPGDEEEVSETWIFPSGGVSMNHFFVTIDTKQDKTVDYELPLSALPPAQPDIPRLMVLIQLRADTPMINCVFATTKENQSKQNDAGTPGELTLMLAEFKAMKKDMNDVKTGNDKLKAEVQGLKASNSALEAKVRGLNASNGELKAKVQSLKAHVDQHRSHVLCFETKIATLEAEMCNRKDKNGKLRNELTRLTNMITPLFLCILLNRAQKKILKKTKFKTWHEYSSPFPNKQAHQDDMQNLTSLPADLSAFISSPNTKVCKDGNKAAHNAKKGDIWDALERERSTATRRLLEHTFEYVFHSEDAKENKGEDDEDDEETDKV